MSYERSDFEELAARKREERSATQLPMLRALAAVKPKMQALTNDENWDRYLAYLSGLIEDLETARATAQAALANPSLVNQDQIMVAKMALHINDAQIAAFEIARDLPKALMQSAEAAREVLDKWDSTRGKPA